MNGTIDRKLNLKSKNSTIDRKLKFSVKYLSYVRKSGCMKFINDEDVGYSKLKTLDKEFKDKEVVKYLFETSNWFLFEKDHKFLNVLNSFSR